MPNEHDWPRFDEECYALRSRLKDIAMEISRLNLSPEMSRLPKASDLNEMMANAVLAYRHLEDAIMRLGKAIQAYGAVMNYER